MINKACQFVLSIFTNIEDLIIEDIFMKKITQSLRKILEFCVIICKMFIKRDLFCQIMFFYITVL